LCTHINHDIGLNFMAGQKKFGAFAGVFTPSILTILGVIMYMRMGWVVGNAGLVGTIIIIVIAHVISISTGLSLSSIATDKKVGAGGIYYILSRSMGIPIGGAIGITLYIGTAFSIALYLIGFAESFNEFYGFATDIDGLRISGAIALLVLTIIALISTSFALKTQFFILAAILVSLLSIFFGTHELAPETVALFPSPDNPIKLEVVFAIFFPAVTGFTAGVAMSGDLKDPKKSLPVGTISAIALGFIVYIGLAFYMANFIDTETLRSDYNVLMNIALYAPAVVAGIWGATLSSALGGILGGPRILQAMSIDKITPKIFGKGRGKSNEPVNALFLVFIIAFAGILIGELDVIARVVSMFYLAAYGFINLAFFLESWANPDFQPTFKVKRWFGLLGFLASFAIMFKLDSLAMFGAIVIIVGIFFWLQRKQIQLDSGDVWHSVWENVVAKGLRRIDAKDTKTNTNWNPNIILFSGASQHQSYLLELSKTISGRTGIVTNFKLILDKENNNPLSKTAQVVKDQNFEKLGIYARQVKVNNIYRGIENIASTFGFSGVEPNTIMMGWPKELRDSKDYAIMTQHLIHLDYNLLYLDFDQKAKFGKYESVDLWWRETDNKNAEMMLNIVRFIIQSSEWNKAKIRVLFVNHNNVENNIIKSKIEKVVEKLRVNVEIIVINNGVEQKAFYDIIALQSASTDLTILGIPDVKTEKQADFVLNTSQLFETIGSTLLIKASDNFNELELNLTPQKTLKEANLITLEPLTHPTDKIIDQNIQELDTFLTQSIDELTYPGLSAVTNFYVKLVGDIRKAFQETAEELKHSNKDVHLKIIQNYIETVIALSSRFKKENLHSIEEVFDKSINKLLHSRTAYVANSPKNLLTSTKKKIKWKPILSFYLFQKIMPQTQELLYQFGVDNFMLLNDLAEGIRLESNRYSAYIDTPNQISTESYIARIDSFIDTAKASSISFETQTNHKMKSFDRAICNEIAEGIDSASLYNQIKKKNLISSKMFGEIKENLSGYAADWHRNQVLAHNQFESGLYLSHSGLILTRIHAAILNRIKARIITPLQVKLDTLTHAEKEYRKWHTEHEEAYVNLDVDEMTEGIVHINFNTLLEEEEEQIIALTPTRLNNVELLSPESFNEFFSIQNDAVQRIEIDIHNIQNHILQAYYLGVLQENLVKLKKEFELNSESIYSTANRLKHLIDLSSSEERNKVESKENSAILTDVQDSLISNQNQLNKLNEGFHLELKANLQHTTDTLAIRTIIDSVELRTKAAKKTVTERRLTKWFNKKQELLIQTYQHFLHFIIQRQDAIERIKFEETHNQYTNIIEQANALVTITKVNPKAKKALPFYYKKLFSGSHVANTTQIRKNELETARHSIKQQESGTNGAIMVIGASQSGKSFLTESIAKIPENTTKYYLNPPNKQTYTATDVHHAFQKIFDKKGTSLSILKQLKHKGTFIINDLEHWWTRDENGVGAINYIASLIEKLGSKHHFIINCNIYSYYILKQTTDISSQLLSTIITRPLSKSELAEIILNRHKLGGASIYYKDELITNTKQIDLLVSSIYNVSNGNVGTALALWLHLICLNDDQELILSKLKETPTLHFQNASWKLLLYQLILHHNLNEAQLNKLYKLDKNNILKTLVSMQKAELVEQTAKHNYNINESVKYFVEVALKDTGII